MKGATGAALPRIGVFDSGVGGLGVWRHFRTVVPAAPAHAVSWRNRRSACRKLDTIRLKFP